VSAHHLHAWKDGATAEVVAIADPDDRKAHQRAREFGVASVRRSAADMLRHDRIDAVDIASPVETHVDGCMCAAERGLPILCQKPLAPTLAEAHALVRQVTGRSRLMVNENWRFRPYYRQVKAWIAAGLIGRVVQFRLATRSSGLVPDANGNRPAVARQPFLATLERLVIGELLIHHLDVARWLLGPLEVRDVQALRGVVAGEHAATIVLSGAQDVIAVVEGNMAAPGFPATPTDRLEIVGTSGSIALDGEELALLGEKPERHRLDLGADYQQGFTNAAAHFATCLRSNQPFETDAADNLHTLALVHDAYAHLEGNA
jgi:predicted dehydrogenase